jgi:hypothetical protein
MIVVVSEETGAISLAHEGRLHQNLSADALKARLLNWLAPSERPHFKPLAVSGLKRLWRRSPRPQSEQSDAASKS